ncbi:hypothetical protein IC175_09240 [Clostridioides sp. ES-S-0123-01]|uniref:YkvI family membrane protein n=1 Tax=unclassified Clostridioides TaxID=2635829 RepID=UPI001D0C6536|nr:hypothetical protein [Clostridioides sp. ES-S-0123-01]MCC0695569.1 hypothetical protein [Clostridioides sp. ES-S-0048-02]MCC0762286.1 hypothetical protein [Clostridioides sp. ES-S-0006-03]
MQKNVKKAKATGSILAIFGVASVLFSSHAGGGFATGNQETQYYVQYGWIAPLMAILAMIILTATMREVIIMYNNNNCKNYKDLFCELWNPYPKLEIIWEIYYYLMVLIAVSAVIAGAAAVFQSIGINYFIAVFIIGIVLLVFTIFGAMLVSKAATAMTIAILVCTLTIFIVGIKAKVPEISEIFSNKTSFTPGYFKPILNTLIYAGFQSVVIPTLASCSRPLLKNSKEATKAMLVSFVMNAVALGLAVTMLMGWYREFTAAGQTTLPTLYVAGQSGNNTIYIIYNVALFLCLMSTGVTTIFGLVNRFEDHKALSFLSSKMKRRVFTACAIMIVSMLISLTGLSNIVKYGYGYCGYLGLFTIVIPFLTLGHYKNKKFAKEHPEAKWPADLDENVENL